MRDAEEWNKRERERGSQTMMRRKKRDDINRRDETEGESG